MTNKQEPKIEFQIVISKNGHLLGRTEWSDDKDAVIELSSSINRECKELRATIESRGCSSVSLGRPVMMGGK